MFTIALWALAAAAQGGAADGMKSTPGRDWPSVVPAPAIDVPMRDAAITRAPDGTYFLTCTLGRETPGVESRVSRAGCRVGRSTNAIALKRKHFTVMTRKP